MRRILRALIVYVCLVVVAQVASGGTLGWGEMALVQLIALAAAFVVIRRSRLRSHTAD